MESKKVFCEECRNDVEYVVKETRMVGSIKDETYQYMGKVAHCTECDSEI